ncbi:MAG: exodeoxyribonuclease V subunit gamma, partial [Balneolaceae bacterium]|nr:exodeoxyribonuclease V subunit gamma [Balneolaceae bacterium]
SHRPSGEAEAWQSILWRSMNEVWEGQPGEARWKHQARVHREYRRRIDDNELTAGSLPQRLILFGLSALQPSYIEALAHSSRLIDLHWFWMDPAADNPDHPLVQAWGEEGRAFRNLLDRFTTPEEIEIELEVVKVPAGGCEGDRPVAVPVPDVSVHSCHSALREVEVLQDRLLDLFAENDDLAPDDILIVTPDIETYAPFIDATFGTAVEGQPRLSYHILEEQRGLRSEVFQTFSTLLSLLNSRCKVTKVLALLSSRAVMDRFEISEDDLDRVNGWIGETKIRWGLDGEHKQQFELPESRLFTWQFGIDRMLLGLAMRPDEDLYRGVYPFGEIESNDDALLLGKLSRFLGELKGSWRYARESRTRGEWAEALNNWIAAFIPDEEAYHGARRGLTEQVALMRETAELGAYRTKFDYPVLLDYMSEMLSREGSRGGYFGHGITFSGPDQMRSIPFRVIGMLGMNNEAFPRSRVAPEFDLMAADPKPGDRVRREDDRYLFLETLHSAGRHIHLSYVGQSDRDDSSRPPSVLISELVDHLEGTRDRDDDTGKMVIEHPLQAYSSRYFREEEPDLYSYSFLNYRVSSSNRAPDSEEPSFLEGTLPPPAEPHTQVSIRDLVRFFENPSRYLLQNRLGLYLWEEDPITEEREPFKVGGLEGYKLGERLLERTLDRRDPAGYLPVAQARGWLPEGWPGEQAFRDKAEEVTKFREAASGLLEASKLDPVEISLQLGDFHLTGLLDALYPDFQIFYRYGRFRAKDLIGLWLYHLALNETEALAHLRHSVLLTREKDTGRPELHRLSPLDNPRGELEKLLELYRNGMDRAIPFFAESSYRYARAVLEQERGHEQAVNKAHGKWTHYTRPELGEGEDPYIKLLFPDHHRHPLESDEFAHISAAFWKPVFKVLEREVAVRA